MTEQPMLPGMEPEEDDVEALSLEKRQEFRENGYSERYQELDKKFTAAYNRVQKNRILNFDPNADEDNLPQYASYCPSRSGPSFKQHARLHHATRAAKMHDGAVYEWGYFSSTWVLVEVWFGGKLL